jgi:hypothetical protein
LHFDSSYSDFLIRCEEHREARTEENWEYFDG